MSKAVRDPLLPLTHYQRIGKQPVKGKSTATIWAIVILVLILVGSGGYFLHNEIEALKKDTTPTPLPTIAEEAEPTVPEPSKASGAKEGEFCGGIAAMQCDDGLECQYDGTYPDAGGKCVEEGTAKSDVIPTLQIKSTETPVSPSADAGTICTQDAMQCPDGSWVGRSGPQCEFKCP